MPHNTQQLEDFVTQVRRDILRQVHKVNSGHPGGSLGCAEFFVALYQEVMEYSTDFTMDGLNEDLFFLSNGPFSVFIVFLPVADFPVEELLLLDTSILVYKVTQQHTKVCRVLEFYQDL